MTGLLSSIRVHPKGPSPVSVTRLPRSLETAFRSAPAQKNPPAPVRIATESDGSESKRRNASASAAAVGRSTALRASGRLIVTMARVWSVSNSTRLISGVLLRQHAARCWYWKQTRIAPKICRNRPYIYLRRGQRLTKHAIVDVTGGIFIAGFCAPLAYHYANRSVPQTCNEQLGANHFRRSRFEGFDERFRHGT